MATTKRKWSAKVTKTSDAMDVASGTFEQEDPKKIARALERDAEKSTRRKSTPYRSAMSMLTFYINRAGTNLTAKQRRLLEEAKDVLRTEFGPRPKASTAQTTAKKSTAKKAATLKKATRKKSSQKKTARKKP